MNHIVVDFEFCILTKEVRKTYDIPLAYEIIEFGAVKLDDDMKNVSSFKAYVKPKYGTIDNAIENLTGITNQMLEDKSDFITVLDEFVEWIGDDEYEICSWSMNDFTQLSGEIELKTDKKKYERLFDGWRDIQEEYSKALGVDSVLSLDKAISSIDENFEGSQHDALCDAINTADLVALLSDEKEFDKRTKSIRELFNHEDEPCTLGSLFPDLFANLSEEGEE